MNREINITFKTIDQPYIDSEPYTPNDVIFGGYEGEDEATKLIITFAEDFTGYTFSLLLNGTSISTTAPIEYEIPSEYMVAEYLRLQVKASLDGQDILSPVIYFEIKRC